VKILPSLQHELLAVTKRNKAIFKDLASQHVSIKRVVYDRAPSVVALAVNGS